MGKTFKDKRKWKKGNSDVESKDELEVRKEEKQKKKERKLKQVKNEIVTTDDSEL